MRRLPPTLALLATLALPGVAAARSTDDAADPAPIVRDGHAALRAGRYAEARQRYIEASTSVPDIGDWLLRRAALVTPDSAARAELYARITLPIVRARLPETEARARERAGDFRGAALRYDSLGLVVDAARMRLAARPGNVERRILRRELVEFIAARAGSPDAQAAIELLSASGLELPPDQALTVARAAARGRMAARAVALFPGAFAAGIATPEDRLAYGLALAQLGRHREALAAYTRVPRDHPAAKEAGYHRAVSLARLGLADSAIAVVMRLVQEADSGSAVAARGLFLAGDLRWRAGDSAGARRYWLELGRISPDHEAAGRAGFLAALVLWESGRAAEAAAEWRKVQARHDGPDGLAAGYWAGRAFEQLGQTPVARGLWQSVIAREPLSYYAVTSARRLGIPSWAPPAGGDQFQSYPDLDNTATRLALLRALEMTEELDWERTSLMTETSAPPERLLALADLLRRDGQPSAASALGRRALRAGAAGDTRTYRLIYPLLHEAELRQQAATAGVDPIVVAALIRQESNWEAAARSRVGALGLMQVMPATGAELARALGIKRWSADRLLDPATNIRLGTHYLASTLRRFDGNLPRALAAYNAGASRVSRWAMGAAADDPELFVERITFTETRDYVRIVQRNLALYRSLYGD